MPARMTVAAPVCERLADVLHRAPVGLGEVAGQRLDGGGQHDADDDRADRDDRGSPVAGVATILGDAVEARRRWPAGRRTRRWRTSTAEITAEM